MKTSIAVGFVVGLAGTGCGNKTLTEAGARVKLMKHDPPQRCTEVGIVSGYKVGPNYLDRLKNGLRNDAADKGANYVRLETLTSNGNASGTAFRCPDQPGAALDSRLPARGLLHHSDRGSPYASHDYRRALEHEPEGRLLGQRHRREFLCHAQGRSFRRPNPRRQYCRDARSATTSTAITTPTDGTRSSATRAQSNSN
jgi:hypothetical protein